MSIVKINDLEKSDITRDCIIAYNINDKEIMKMRNMFRMYGVKDIEVLNRKNADSKISDVINKEINTSQEEGLNQRLVLFNNINSTKVSAIIDNFKKLKIAKPLTAYVTETNLEWSVNTLVQNILEERQAMKAGNTPKY